MSLFRFLLLVLYISGGTFIQGQELVQYREAKEGKIRLSNKLSIPYENAGYTLVLPSTKPVNGLVVFFNSDRDTLNKIFRFANPKGLAVAYVTTGNSLEFLFEEKTYLQLENYIYKILTDYNIPKTKLLYLGMSLAGTRALKFSLFETSEKSKHQLIPKALAICDAPLDFVRFWRECYKAKMLNLNKVAANEGDWVTSYLESNLGGTPDTELENYIHYSPFCYTSMDQEHLKALEGTYVRAYTEPDVNWWIENRGKDYYGMNSIDLAAWINALKYSGHKHASLINTTNKGYHPNGRRHPHSWSIVNEKELIHWFSVIMKK
jgi:hypothetical protein